MRTSNSFLLVAALFVTTLTALQACFYPDGKNATGLFPCKPDAETSHCCREADLCLTNGMCFSSGLNSIVRRGCTDKTWKSPDCPNYCALEEYRSGDAVMTSCGNYNEFCCGQDQDARACCNEGNTTLAAQVPGGDVIPWDLDPTTSSPAPSNSACPTMDSSGASTTSRTTLSDTSLKTQRNALIGTTAGFAMLMLVAAILAILWRRRLKQEEREGQIKERERQRLQQERDALDQEKQRLTTEKQGIERAIANLPAPMRRELEAARRNTGSGL